MCTRWFLLPEASAVPAGRPLTAQNLCHGFPGHQRLCLQIHHERRQEDQALQHKPPVLVESAKGRSGGQERGFRRSGLSSRVAAVVGGVEGAGTLAAEVEGRGFQRSGLSSRVATVGPSTNHILGETPIYKRSNASG